MWNSQPVVAIFGSSQTIDGDEEYRQARVLGRLLARAGFVVCNGGYGGSMEATSRGVSEAGGVSIGLTLGAFEKDEANPFVTREIKNATLFERLANFVQLAEAFVVLKGGVGTLAEFSAIWNLMQTRALKRKPFILLGRSWPKLVENLRQGMEIRDKDLKLFHIVSTPEQAMEILKNHVRAKP
ncbi:MAG: LOG family protein [Candidatus Hydrogenedentota bacterium]|nr:MAG: LOG family protein [Candidatus Hydrogenedentota bacterium]